MAWVDIANGETGASARAKLNALGASNDLKAPLASPSLTGTPLAPTAAPGTNTTQISTTAFVTAAVALAVTGLLDLKGATNCSGNPNYPAASTGDAYVVSVAGKIGGGAGIAVDIGDVFVASADNAGGTQAAVGASWFILEHNLAGALLAANNLSDVASAAIAATNLGLGTGSNVTHNTLTAVSIKAGAGVASAGAAQMLLNAAGGVATALQIYQDGIESWTMGMPASGATMQWRASNTLALSLTGGGALTLAGVLSKKAYTVATLPSPTTGDEARVTDALTPVFGATVAAGGAANVPVFYNGANWIVG